MLFTKESNCFFFNLNSSWGLVLARSYIIYIGSGSGCQGTIGNLNLNKKDGDLFEWEFWGSEGEALVGGGTSEMEGSLRCCEEPQAKVSIHCKSLQALRSRCYAPYQSGFTHRKFSNFNVYGSSISLKFRLILNIVSKKKLICIYNRKHNSNFHFFNLENRRKHINFRYFNFH